jgi:hypothetical protein
MRDYLKLDKGSLQCNERNKQKGHRYSNGASAVSWAVALAVRTSD